MIIVQSTNSTSGRNQLMLLLTEHSAVPLLNGRIFTEQFTEGPMAGTTLFVGAPEDLTDGIQLGIDTDFKKLALMVSPQMLQQLEWKPAVVEIDLNEHVSALHGAPDWAHGTLTVAIGREALAFDSLNEISPAALAAAKEQLVDEEHSTDSNWIDPQEAFGSSS